MADISSANSPPSPPTPAAAGADVRTKRRRKLIIYEEEDEEEINQSSSSPPLNSNNKKEEEEENEDENEEEEEEAKPIGNVVRVSWKGDSKMNHFNAFQADGISYQLEDTVLVSPEEYSTNLRPSVAIIKDITATEGGILTVTGQKFYRAHMIEKETGGNWESCETRELFYTFDKREFRADNVLHKCRVHFIPPNKKIPSRTEHPGFIVRKIYDAKSKKLFELLDPGFEDFRKREINVLVQKTISRIPDWEDEIVGS